MQSARMRSTSSPWSTVPNDGFYWKTYGDKDDAKGSYYSPSSVTLMIARELKREIDYDLGPRRRGRAASGSGEVVCFLEHARLKHGT
jgi:hypothetical protein